MLLLNRWWPQKTAFSPLGSRAPRRDGGRHSGCREGRSRGQRSSLLAAQRLSAPARTGEAIQETDSRLDRRLSRFATDLRVSDVDDIHTHKVLDQIEIRVDAFSQAHGGLGVKPTWQQRVAAVFDSMELKEESRDLRCSPWPSPSFPPSLAPSVATRNATSRVGGTPVRRRRDQRGRTEQRPGGDSPVRQSAT